MVSVKLHYTHAALSLPRSREFSICYTKEFGEYCGAIRAEIKR